MRKPPAPGLLESEASISAQGRRCRPLNGGRRAASAVTPAGGGAAAGAAPGAAGPEGGRRPGRGALVPARGPEGRRKTRAGRRARGCAERRARGGESGRPGRRGLYPAAVVAVGSLSTRLTRQLELGKCTAAEERKSFQFCRLTIC